MNGVIRIVRRELFHVEFEWLVLDRCGPLGLFFTFQVCTSFVKKMNGKVRTFSSGTQDHGESLFVILFFLGNEFHNFFGKFFLAVHSVKEVSKKRLVLRLILPDDVSVEEITHHPFDTKQLQLTE